MYALNSYWSGLAPEVKWLAVVVVVLIVYGLLRGASYRRQLNAARLNAADIGDAYNEELSRSNNLELQLAQLRATLDERQMHFDLMQKTQDESRELLKQEFEAIGQKILTAKGKELTSQGQDSLHKLLQPFREQIEAFQKRANHIHDESLRSNVVLNTEIKRVVDMGLHIGQEASRLSNALHNDKKVTGNWGEVQLERSLQLAGLECGYHYEAQAVFTDAQGKRKQPDFIVNLPDNKHLVIDSKVSLVAYNQAVAAEGSKDQQGYMDAHVQAIRNHVNDLDSKNYSNLVGLDSPSFVLMFMPIEGAYIDALRHDPKLFDFALQKNIILVSHTTLMPVLRTVANLWLIVRSNEQAHELSQHAGDIYNQVALMAERLKSLGYTLGTVSRHYNDTVVAVAGQQGLFGKVARFADLSAKASKTMPELTELDVDFHKERLEQTKTQL